MIRDYERGDGEELRRIHAEQGVDYQFPDLEHPLFFLKKVRVVDGRVNAALVLKLCAETHLLLGEMGPQEKMTAMRELQAAVVGEAYARGLDEIHAAIPVGELPPGFDRRLRQLGWVKDRPGWELWSRSTHIQGWT